jgi:1-acyl-sn-glycerol-3-phosphate acyltransferase
MQRTAAIRAAETRRRTPFPLRVYRYARVSVHVFQGVATTAFVFPRIGLPQRQELIRRWSQRLLSMLGVETRLHGLPVAGLPGNLLIVANHISWLDIFVLNALQPSRFIGKAEIKRWPLVGRLVADCGTLFLERGRRHDAHRINQHARDVLTAGETIAIFPEGTTTDGTTVLPFHGSLLQPVVDAHGHVQPIAIRYRGLDGSHSDAPVYVGDTSLLGSLWRLLGERALIVEVTLVPALAARARHRRELSREAENAIRAALELPSIGSGPEIRVDRPA